MSLSEQQEQQLQALIGRVTELENKQAKSDKYIATLEKASQEYTNRLVPIALKSNTEALSATRVLLDVDFVVQYLDPGGASRTVTLPPESLRNHMFIIVNTADAAETLNVKDVAAATVVDIAQNKQAILISDGTTWKTLDASTGAGDIFVLNTGDSMTGDLTFDGDYHPVFAPGSDTDQRLFEVAVTGTPYAMWDESESMFGLSHGLWVAGSSVIFAGGLEIGSEGVGDLNMTLGHIINCGAITLTETIKILERAAADDDTAGYGQLWAKNTTPTQLWYTDDVGNDTQIV